MSTAATETDPATQTDAQHRVTELKAVLRRLWPDRDDSMVLCEIHSVLGQLRAAESEIAAHRREQACL